MQAAGALGWLLQSRALGPTTPCEPLTRTPLLLPVSAAVVRCATLPPGARNPRDPWERMNRATYKFNDKLDKAVLRPVARGYRKVTPHFVQTGIRNFIDNSELSDRHGQRPAAGTVQAVLAPTPCGCCEHDHRHRRAVRSGDRAWGSTRTTAISARRSASGA